MSFPRYPKYKDSGVEWLGEVPEHWDVKRLRYVSNVRKGRLPSVTSPAPTADTDLPYLSMEFLRGEVDNPSYVPVSENLLRAESGDLLLLWDGSNAGEFLRAKQGVVSSTLALIEARNIEKEFLFFSCKARERQLKDQTVGMGIPHVSGDELRSFLIPCPARAEQTQIAAFLDRETAKIDELVAEQQRLIELLKEKRQAVISHAVTKGLNPKASMKPSGIEWLGDIPAHWRIIPLRWSSRCCSGDGLSSEEVESLEDERHIVRVIGGNGLLGYTMLGNIEHAVLAVGRVGALCGNVHIVNRPAWITDNALILDPAADVFELQFLSFVLRSRDLNNIASKTAQPLITGSQVSDQRMPAPPLSEQREIAVVLSLEITKFDTLTAEAQRAIDLLQERRTALISAAVTGQIDVRSALKRDAA